MMWINKIFCFFNWHDWMRSSNLGKLDVEVSGKKYTIPHSFLTRTCINCGKTQCYIPYKNGKEYFNWDETKEFPQWENK